MGSGNGIGIFTDMSVAIFTITSSGVNPVPTKWLVSENDISSLANKADKSLVTISVNAIILTNTIFNVDEQSRIYTEEYEDGGENSLFAFVGQTNKIEIGIYKLIEVIGDGPHHVIWEKIHNGIDITTIRSDGFYLGLENQGVWTSQYDGTNLSSLVFVNLYKMIQELLPN